MKTEVLIFLLGLAVVHSAATKKSSETSDTSPSESSSSEPSPSESSPSPAGPAILAIEIVDSNSTEKNSTKRTIESALGYGYQGNYYPTSQGKKYMVYPYSQHDIPPAQKDTGKYLARETLNIQKSVSYNLGTKIEPVPTSAPSGGYTASSGGYAAPTAGYTAPTAGYTTGSQEYYPSTLYSTVGQGGVIGGLSTSLPQQVSAATTIPVIILRVYTNQLSDPSALYPNLPQSHPYSNLNNVNLQAIISNYLQQQMYQTQQNYKYQPPVYQMYAQSPTYYYSQGQQDAASLPTHENYPSNSHTRVVYHGPKGHVQNTQQYYVPQAQYSKTQTYSSKTQTYSPQTYSAPQSTQYTAPSPQYSSSSPQYSSSSPQYSSSSPQYSSSSPQYSSSSPQYSSSSSQYTSSTNPQNSQYVYTDTNGQSFIYVDPAQLQQGQYYQQEYQQQDDQQQDYQQGYQQQEYQQQDYKQQQQEYQPEYQQQYQEVYQKAQEDRKYLPAASQSQTSPDKVYNYHAEGSKDRSKKSSGAPVTFESKKIETKRKA